MSPTATGPVSIAAAGRDDFPSTARWDRTRNGNLDAFVTVLSASGSLVNSTLLGGADDDLAMCVALDPQGRVVVAPTEYRFSRDVRRFPVALIVPSHFRRWRTVRPG